MKKSAPRARRPGAAGMKGLSVIIPNFNGAATLGRCLDSLKALQRQGAEVLVVDNGSADGSGALAAKRRGVKLIALPQNLGFGTALNRGAAASKGAVLLFLNNDAWLEPGAAQRLLDLLDRRPQAAAVNAAVYRGQGDVVDSAGGAVLFLPFGIFGGIGGNRRAGDVPLLASNEPFECFYADACTMAVRRSAFQALGGFEERFFMYYEELDFCWRARLKGWQIWCEPRALARHEKGSTPKSRELSLKILGGMEHNLLAMAWSLYPRPGRLPLFALTLAARVGLSTVYAFISPALAWAKFKGMARFAGGLRRHWGPRRRGVEAEARALGWSVFAGNPGPVASPLGLGRMALEHFMDIRRWYRRSDAKGRAA